MKFEIEQTFEVGTEDASTRLDRWLTDAVEDMDYEASRSQVQDWITNGFVTRANLRVKASEQVQAGYVYEVKVPQAGPIEIEGSDIPIEITYVDDDLVVVNKQRGLVVHPAAGHARGTLVNALIGMNISLCPQGGQLRPGVVHRIDKDTSGLLVLARSQLAYARLAEQLKEHTMERRYLAIVHGNVTHDHGTIDAPIGRDPKNRQRMAVVAQGKEAITHFQVLERFGDYTYVELKLETGRTHQIRVHMHYIGHPLAGDPVYGRRHTLAISGQALHAHTLGFEHPQSHEMMQFQSELPTDMAELLTQLRTL